MRRLLLRSLPVPFTRSASYAAGLFHFKVIPEELTPFPAHSFSEDEGENLVTLARKISDGEKVDGLVPGAQIALEYGGLGLGHTAYSLVCEEMGRSGGLERLLAAVQSTTLAAHVISSCGSKELKGKYLTKMSDGTEVVGWAMQEGNGADVSMNTTKATLAEGDSKYILRGRKVCAAAEDATHFLVLAKTKTQILTEKGPEETERSSLFMVDRNAKGVSLDQKMVVLDDVESEEVVGVVGEGFRNQLTTSMTLQYAGAAALLGSLKGICQEVSDEVPDGWCHDVLASCLCSMYAMESALYAVTGNLDRQTEDILLEACFSAGFIYNTVRECVASLSDVTQISSSHYRTITTLLSTMEHPDYLNGAAVCSGVEEYGLAFQATSTLQMMQRRTLRMLGVKERLPIREVDCSKVDAAIIEFGNAVETTFVRNTTSVPFQQLLLNRLGEAAQLLYAASAAASRAAMAAKKGLPTAKVEKKLASAFIDEATTRVKVLCNECQNTGMTADDICKRIALELCDAAARS